MFNDITMKKRGQIASEYLWIVGVVLLLLIPVTVLFYTYHSSSSDRANISTGQEAVNSLAAKIETVYYLSEGTQTIVEVEVPEKVTKFEIVNDMDDIDNRIDEIYMEIINKGGNTVVSKKLDVPIRLGRKIDGTDYTLPLIEGVHKIKLISTNGRVCLTSQQGSC